MGRNHTSVYTLTNQTFFYPVCLHVHFLASLCRDSIQSVLLLFLILSKFCIPVIFLCFLFYTFCTFSVSFPSFIRIEFLLVFLLILSRFCPDSVQILSSFCLVSVQFLSSFCSVFVQFLFSFCPISLLSVSRFSFKSVFLCFVLVLILSHVLYFFPSVFLFR